MATQFKVIKFGSDTKYRKQWFTGISFSHPAKMSLPLQLWIIDNFTKEGETILDPMAGSGTILVACSMGRHVITLELEDKFVQMQKDNWEKIKQRGCQLGYQMGTATILQGDARVLEGILCDSIITSPPYCDSPIGGGLNTKPPREGHNDQAGRSSSTPSQVGAGKYDKIITSPPFGEAFSGGGIARYGHYSDPELANRAYSAENMNIQKQIKRVQEGKAKMKRPDVFTSEGNKAAKGYFEGNYSHNPENLGNLPYGSIDAVISSPPHGNRLSDGAVNDNDPQRMSYRQALQKVDAVISSPPYEQADQHKDNNRGILRKNRSDLNRWLYSKEQAGNDKSNIGNLKSDSYLSAMLLVYQNCFAVLKGGGLMILVTKNFIRNKQQVRLDLDTIKLCEQAGFTFQDRWYRELANQSFWRTIYYQKFPDVEPIKFEDILVFEKLRLNG